MSLEWQKKKHRNKRYTIQNAQFQLILRNGLSCCCFYFLFFLLGCCIRAVALKHTPHSLRWIVRTRTVLLNHLLWKSNIYDATVIETTANFQPMKNLCVRSLLISSVLPFIFCQRDFVCINKFLYNEFNRAFVPLLRLKSVFLFSTAFDVVFVFLKTIKTVK